jgi:hypothetical protein
LVYWQEECPAHDIGLSSAAGIAWKDILKNPSQSDSTFRVNLEFPNPLPMTGCIGLFFTGGPSVEGAAVTMSADLNLTYQQASEQCDSEHGAGPIRRILFRPELGLRE